MRPGSEVEFKPTKGKTRKGTIEKLSRKHGKAKILLDGDPFPVTVKLSQLSPCDQDGKSVSSSAKVQKSNTQQGETQMPTTRVTAKELRKQAQALGVEDWEDMGRNELEEAVKRAEASESKSKSTRKRRSSSSKSKATKTKKAPAKKSAAKPKTTAKRKTNAKPAAKQSAKAKTAPKANKAEPNYSDPPKGTPKAKERENPFRKGSNLHSIFPILVPRGGKRRTLAERLHKKVELHPYKRDEGEIDLIDYDKRILLAAQALRDKHGYTIERKGRGLDGSIKVFVPGSEDDPRASSNGATRKSSKRKSSK